MLIHEYIEVMKVAETFIESLGGSGLTDRFVPGPESVELSYRDDHAQLNLNYHISGMTDADRAVVVESVSRLDKVLWGTATNPYGVAWLTTDNLRVKVTIEVYMPGEASRGPLLREALDAAGWSAVRGVG